MKFLKYIVAIFFLGVAFKGFAQQPFTPGDIVVYRVGDGSRTLDLSMSRVYLDEYTPNGSLVQSILMPTSGKKLTTMGSLFPAGYLTLSTDGKYLVVPGWDVDEGLAPATITGINRSVALVDFNGAANSVTVITNNPGTAFPTSAASNDGTGMWLSGSSQVEYVLNNASTSTSIATVSAVTNGLAISQGQLYAATTNRTLPLVQVGNNLPITTGQSLTALPGLPQRTNPQQFAFADLDPGIAGMDVLYLASQSGSAGGIQKYSLVNDVWKLNGVVGTPDDLYAGLTVKVSSNGVTIFATRKGGNSAGVAGGELVYMTDNSGYNGTLTGTPTVMASITTADTKAFRGVALVPQPAAFTPGNIVVYRVGDGTAALDGSMSKVYLDEYTPTGNLVQSILMPVSGRKVTMIGSSESGYLTLSSNGKYLVVPGWDVDLGVVPASVVGINRSVGVVDFTASINNVTVVTNNPGNSLITSAASDNGTNLWLSGGNLIDYISNGASTSISIASLNSPSYGIGISQGQLYTSTTNRSQPLIQVGNGLPTTDGQSIATLAGLPQRTNPRQFAFADLDPTVPGMDVLYLASQSSTVGGIQKYSLVNGVWVFNGVVGTTDDLYTGLTIRAAANTVTIFATRKGANSAGIMGGELVSLSDNSGYNGTLTGSPAVIAFVATPDTKAFRGVANVPVGCPPVLSLRVPDISANEANILWNTPNSGSGNYEYAVTTSSAPPVSGTAISDTVVHVSGLVNATTYYVFVRTTCTASRFSEWTSLSFTTGCNAPASPYVSIHLTPTGILTAKWPIVFGALNYEYFISTTATPPSSGTAISDTSITVPDLNSVSQYYLHVRSGCGSGSFSQWTTKAFSTSCFVPSPNITLLTKNAGVKWNTIANAAKYEYALTYNPLAPLSGSYTTDTSYVINKTDEGTAYYFHLRAICANGSVSEWNTIKFNIPGMEAYPNPVKDILQIQLYGISNPSSEILIGDVTGRVVARSRLNNNTATINTRGWAAGIYLVRYGRWKE